MKYIYIHLIVLCILNMCSFYINVLLIILYLWLKIRKTNQRDKHTTIATVSIAENISRLGVVRNIYLCNENENII